MKLGAFDYITKPSECEEILHRTMKAIVAGETNRDMQKLLKLKEKPGEKGLLLVVGESKAIKDIRAQIQRISSFDFPVLITGETGTGKNLIAKAIHLNSARAEGPFISVSCASIPEHLFESELFGHSKGAFTGALIERKGLFEEANGGTILLDEIGIIPKPLQSKLLGVLQDKVIRKVGTNKEVLIDARIIAATNSDLVKSVKVGEFRQDLFYRVNTAHLHIPPLRERREDIPVLAEYFLAECAGKMGKGEILLCPDSLKKLLEYDYPGNVRELHNIISLAASVSSDGLVLEKDLPFMLSCAGEPASCISEDDVSLPLEQLEKKILMKNIERNFHNLAKVCKELKISRTTLWRKMKKYSLT
jgi:transcriptional regulator with PAS, ATPase and Fis domain